jgi:hypothetical protein
MGKTSQKYQKKVSKFVKNNFKLDCRDRFVLIDLP